MAQLGASEAIRLRLRYRAVVHRRGRLCVRDASADVALDFPPTHGPECARRIERWRQNVDHFTRMDDAIVDVYLHARAAREALRLGDAASGRRQLAIAEAGLSRRMASSESLAVEAWLQMSLAALAAANLPLARRALRAVTLVGRTRPSADLAERVRDVSNRVEAAERAAIGLSDLTPAELRVLALLPTHLRFQEIAEELSLSKNTVKTHALAIYSKLGASDRSEAVEQAMASGLLPSRRDQGLDRRGLA